MIEIRKDEAKKKESLFLDKTEIKQVSVRSFSLINSKSDRYYHIKVNGFETANVLSQQRLQEFPLRLTLQFMDWLDLHGFSISLDIDTIAYSKSNPKNFTVNKNIITLKIVPYLISWNFAYSFNEYKLEFDENWKESLKQDIEEIDWMLKSKNTQLIINSIEFRPSLNKTFAIESSEGTIFEIVSPFVETILICHNKTINNLKNFKDENSLSLLFNFPEELKVPCEQYLLYFAQFLRDLGINATSDLKEEAGKVLFSVTPTDDIEALDKIREVLAVYLNLPSSPIVYNESFAAMRLHQQIDNLQYSQRMAEREIRSSERELRLAQTVIESQDKIILQKDTIIEQQSRVIEKITSKSIMMDSLENKEEYEEIYDGIRSYENEFVKKYTGIGINVAKSIKTGVKNVFGKEGERRSILGLDEETNQENS